MGFLSPISGAKNPSFFFYAQSLHQLGAWNSLAMQASLTQGVMPFGQLQCAQQPESPAWPPSSCRSIFLQGLEIRHSYTQSQNMLVKRIMWIILSLCKRFQIHFGFILGRFWLYCSRQDPAHSKFSINIYSWKYCAFPREAWRLTQCNTLSFAPTGAIHCPLLLHSISHRCCGF